MVVKYKILLTFAFLFYSWELNMFILILFAHTHQYLFSRVFDPSIKQSKMNEREIKYIKKKKKSLKLSALSNHVSGNL